MLDLIERVRRAQFKLDDTANNNNNLNTLPAGSRLYSTPQDRPVNQSTFNDRPSNYSRTTNNNKNVNIATVNIQTQNMTPADIKRTISSIDNGIPIFVTKNINNEYISKFNSINEQGSCFVK